jgi:hypothetical protein
MSLSPSGAISLGDVRTEFRLGSGPISMTDTYGFETGMPASGEFGMDDYHSVTATTEFKWGWNGDTGTVPTTSGDHTYTWTANTNGTVYLRLMGINGDWRSTQTGCVSTGCGPPTCAGVWNWTLLNTSALGQSKGGRHTKDYVSGGCGDQTCRLVNVGGTTTHTITGIVAGQDYTISIPMRAMHNAAWFYSGYVRIGRDSTPSQGF